MAAGIRDATLHVLPGEGHFANVQVPEKVNPLLASALGIPAALSRNGKRTDSGCCGARCEISPVRSNRTWPGRRLISGFRL